jgi:hypothetical protein
VLCSIYGGGQQLRKSFCLSSFAFYALVSRFTTAWTTGFVWNALRANWYVFFVFLLFLLVDMNLVPVLLLFIAGATILFGHRDEGTAGLH